MTVKAWQLKDLYHYWFLWETKYVKIIFDTFAKKLFITTLYNRLGSVFNIIEKEWMGNAKYFYKLKSL